MANDKEEVLFRVHSIRKHGTMYLDTSPWNYDDPFAGASHEIILPNHIFGAWNV